MVQNEEQKMIDLSMDRSPNRVLAPAKRASKTRTSHKVTNEKMKCALSYFVTPSNIGESMGTKLACFEITQHEDDGFSSARLG